MQNLPFQQRVEREVAAGRGSIDELLENLGASISPEKAMRRIHRGQRRNVTEVNVEQDVLIWRGRRALLVDALNTMKHKKIRNALNRARYAEKKGT